MGAGAHILDRLGLIVTGCTGFAPHHHKSACTGGRCGDRGDSAHWQVSRGG